MLIEVTDQNGWTSCGNVSGLSYRKDLFDTARVLLVRPTFEVDEESTVSPSTFTFSNQTYAVQVVGLKAASSKDRKPVLNFHLPSYDYLLFGIELFVRGRMTCSAL